VRGVHKTLEGESLILDDGTSSFTDNISRKRMLVLFHLDQRNASELI